MDEDKKNHAGKTKTFSIGWPPAYQPIAAEEAVADKRAIAAKAVGAKCTAKRARRPGVGFTPGFGSLTGTMPGLSTKACPPDPAKTGAIKKPAKL